MRILLALLAVPALAFQASETAPAETKPAEQPSETKTGPQKPTPREKALQLLNAALDTAPGAQPGVAVPALARIAENYEIFDHAKAVKILKQAFDVSWGIPPSATTSWREVAQGMVALASVPLSLPDAIGMLGRIDGGNGYYDPRKPAITAAVAVIIGKNQFDEAISLVNRLGATGQYPFTAARLIYEKLPNDDPRRPAVFAYALSAYGLRPAEEFGDFLIKHWKEMPLGTVEAVIGQVVETILNEKDDGTIETIAGPRGPLVLNGRQDVELFDLMHVIRAIDPKRADQILESRPELKAALSRFPNGHADVGPASRSRGYADAASRQQATAEAVSRSRTAQVLASLEKLEFDESSPEAGHRDLLKLLKIAKTIPLPESRIDVLAQIAGVAGEEEPDLAQSLLSECMDQLKEIKDPVARVQTWNTIAEAAHAIDDDKLAWEAIDQAVSDADAIFKLDTDADNPLTAPRDMWPSTNAYRRIVIVAAKLFGVDADALLPRFSDPDLALFSRVEMAQALLERPHGNWATIIRQPKK